LTTQFYHAAIDEQTGGSSVINCGLQDNGCWTAHAAASATPWLEQFGGDGAYVAVANGATSGGNYYFSSQYSYVYRILLDASGGFAGDFRRVDPASLNEQNVLFINPLTLDPNESKRMYMASLMGLWRNNDVTAPVAGNPNQESDQGWVQVTNRPQEFVTAIAVSRSPANTNAQTGKLYKIANASNAPAGTTPTTITGANFPNGGYINAIAIDPTDANKVLVAFSNYRTGSIFSTTNGGTSWTEVDGTLGGDDGPSVRSVLIMPASGSSVFLAGTSTGLYSTSNLNGAGTVWTKEGANEIRDLVVSWLVGRPSDGTVVAATHGGGAFSATVTGGAQTCATRGGDANGSNSVDVTDLMAVVNHILELADLSPGAQLCVDVAEDELINVLDLVKIVQIILGLPEPLREDGLARTGIWSRADETARTRFTVQGQDLVALELALELPAGTEVSGSPSVSGAPAARLSWNVSGNRLVVLVAPGVELPVLDGSVIVEVPLRHESASSEDVQLVGLVAAAKDGRAIALEESLPAGSADRLALTITSAFPNPTSGPIELQYRTATASAVEARIIAADGREIRSLVAPDAGAGAHRLTWDGRDDAGHAVASGTYFVKLESNGSTASRRVLVLR
jgi:hypothetical protein